MDRCEACRFVYADIAPDDLPGALREGSRRVAATVAAVPADSLRVRPAPAVWSALEYACHVRDMLEVQRARLGLALTEDCPEFESMGRDERPARDRYNEQDPAVVTAQIRSAGDALADAYAALQPAQLERTAVYGWPTRAERSMLWVGRHTVHELVHHHADIEAVAAGRVPG